MLSLAANQIKELGDLGTAIDNLFNIAQEMIPDICESGDDQVNVLEKLKEVMEDFCDLEKTVKIRKRIVEDMKKRVTAWETTDSDTELNMESMYECISSQNFKIKNHPMKVQEINNLGIKISTLKGSNLDDVCAVQEIGHMIDPLTKQGIVHPVKNRICGHFYEKNTIYEYLNITSNQEKKKCPYALCPNTVMTVEDLIDLCDSGANDDAENHDALSDATASRSESSDE